MAKEVNSGFWKLVSVSNMDGSVVTVHACGLGAGCLVMTSVKGEANTVGVVFVPDMRLKEIVEKDDKGAVKAHYWAFNMGNIG